LNALTYMDGEYVESPPLSGKELTYFPQPIGYQYTYTVLHGELATIPLNIKGVKRVTYKVTWDEKLFPIISFLREIGFMNKEPVNVIGQKVSPANVFSSLLSPLKHQKYFEIYKVVVKGLSGNFKTKYTYFIGPIGYSEELKLDASTIATAYNALIGLKLLINGKYGKGVVAPETIDNPILWVKEARNRGIRIVEIEEIVREI